MKKSSVYIVSTSFAAVLVYAACSGGSSTPPPPPPPPPPANTAGGGGAAAAPTGDPGTIKVTVSYDGQAPKPGMLNRKQDPFCAKTPMASESLMVSKAGHVKNAVVRLVNVKGKYDAPADKVSVNQEACMYRPRVQVARKGQTVSIANSDGTLHNVHAYKGESNSNWFNRAQPAKAAPIEKKFPNGDGQYIFRCDVHPWMAGYIITTDHPFAGVTGDDGIVSLADVPAGKYKLEVWHEKLPLQQASVTVKAGEVADVSVKMPAAS